MLKPLLSSLLLASSIASAIPLHIGESWVWQVTKRDDSELYLRTALVLDSVSIPEGRVWTILAKDSLSRLEDTAMILEWPSGRQNWLRQSSHLGWELQPRDPEDTSIVIVGSDTSNTWGEVSSMEPANHAGRFISQKDRYFCEERISLGTETNCDRIVPNRTRISVTSDNVTWSDPPSGPWWVSNPLPVHVWSDTLGMEYALTFYNSKRGVDWRLIRHNGQQIIPKQDRIKIPLVGTELTWIGESKDEYKNNYPIFYSYSKYDSYRIHWKIIQAESDSEGWQRVSVAHKNSSCSHTVSKPSVIPSFCLLEALSTLPAPLSIG